MINFSEQLIIIVNMSNFNFRNKYPAVHTQKYVPAVCEIKLLLDQASGHFLIVLGWMEQF